MSTAPAKLAPELAQLENLASLMANRQSVPAKNLREVTATLKAARKGKACAKQIRALLKQHRTLT